MIVLLLSLIFLGVLALLAGRLINLRQRRHTANGEAEAPAEVPKSRPEGCCGQHEVCEKESLLAAVSKEVEYYEDEELDDFRGRAAAAYTPAEAEKFREVLYTMRTDEVAGWVRSLTLRGINLPDELRDEVLLLVGERRGMSV